MRSTQGIKELRKQYTIQRDPLGAGSYGQVFKATNIKDNTHVVAIKVIEKTGLSKEEIEDILNEVNILSTLDHPNIVKYYETYDDVRFLYLVMQFCPNGELFDSFDKFVKKGETYTEKDSARLMKKCLSALQHCHSMNIVHRDIKPENILFDSDGEIRLADFGLAKQTKAVMDVVAGTPYFMAPEVIDGHY